ncbi:MAG: DNA mismatch repair protein [Sulfurimonas sp. RIFOXYD12_FULL_33_39]|uniref:MutS-related protein n=1 Tax=unclassified Sulfurimonas TaxID=2623549 RepID=UPI0008B11743|nr:MULTISPECIES: HNH endonuclease [unclassified Sulfurimonas]OHE10177.1 MAG: DNA mismatch repair protein [Sulfurimonas sp. RIFOXYD12_FULL_33_39]OHE14602.1 MAG: DNA mismatch repair protein [Sulfurimonas sp. RIFOXYD2_FULL_34_21]DAB28301.1 MAG TPA: DNA mismatch repair protein [Sulfurimonas sp. UBA10385]
MFASDLGDILENKDKLLTQTYFELQRYFEDKYGNDTVVFMEIGTFFEVYEVNNDDMQIGKAKEIAELLNIQLTKKNKNIVQNSDRNPLLAGVPAVSFDRYLSRLISEQKYTVIVVKQKGNPPKISRYIAQIVSPGTNFDYVIDNDDNYIVSILVDKHRDIYVVGYSAIDVTTGKTWLYESHGTSEDPSYALDEIFNLLNVNRTSEIVVTFLDGVEDQRHAMHYLEIPEHYNYSVNNQRPRVEFQNELFRQVYQIHSLLSPIEHLDLERSPMITESLAILIHFVIEHDIHIVQKLNYPKIIDNRRFMYLGNSALDQMGVISKDKKEFTLLKMLDKSSTAIGRRLLKERLLNPIIEKDELERRYNLIERVSSHVRYLDEVMRGIYDLQRLSRRLYLGRLHPFEMNHIYESMLSIKELIQYAKKHKIQKIHFHESEVDEFLRDISKSIDLDVSRRFTNATIDENFLMSGVDEAIDTLVKENSTMLIVFEDIMSKIETLLESSNSSSTNSLVTLGLLEKEGYYISLSKNRFSMIETEFSKREDFKDFAVKKLTNSVKITSAFTDTLSDNIMKNRRKIVSLAKERYIALQEVYERRYSLLFDRIISYVADLDVGVSSSKVAQEYKHSRPMIIDVKSDENFMQIMQLRHPLIEIQTGSGIYVPNDIVMGNRDYMDLPHPKTVMLDVNVHDGHEINGVLLYGINSSGKSSLMKSIGLATLMAQSGFFVSAAVMKFSLFDSLFTRIVSRDNLAKGLSTFAVEMLELKNIFNRATVRSLILGDEISHGTETLSGVAIVSSAIIKLSRLRSIFLFATHLHQLSTMKEIRVLKNVVDLHLSVEYDELEDKLLFNRVLQNGSGSSIYGLEFAKSLHMDSDFLDTANKIRKRLARDFDELELLVKKKTSKYNKELYVTKCVICGDMAEDVHHINHKSLADESGFIGHFHKDSKHNLIPLCREHHKAIHDGKIRVGGFVMTSKGLELTYEEQISKVKNKIVEEPQINGFVLDDW